MNQEHYLEKYEKIPPDYEQAIFDGISKDAFDKKELPPIDRFGLFVKNKKGQVVGGLTGVTMYGSLYVDMLWVDPSLRGLGWGSKLMQEAEHIGKQYGATFATVNTMDFEALPFYQKLGYFIEFKREGYDKNSSLFLLRKPLDTHY